MTALSTAPANASVSATQLADPLAAASARANIAGNLVALGETQPTMADRVRDTETAQNWHFGRDGFLTARDPSTGWLAGCSVPRAAARAMSASLDVPGAGACFLHPFHAAALVSALEKLRPEQMIVAIVPDFHTFVTMLHCADFSFDIAHHRLWLAAGEAWIDELASVFSTYDGLPTPTQFVRLRDAHDETAEALIPAAQRIIGEQVSLRAEKLAALRSRIVTRSTDCLMSTRVGIISNLQFRLWNDAGDALASIGRSLGCAILDADLPTTSSVYATADFVSRHEAVVTANLFRPEGVSKDVAWLTWVTSPAMPAFSTAGACDRLIVAFPELVSLAASQGWPIERIDVARAPALARGPIDTERRLTIIADVSSLEPPDHIVDMSSHRLLWEHVREEVVSNPFAVGSDPLRYLRRACERSGVAIDTLDANAMVRQLIEPAYQIGVAKTLLDAGLPLDVYGAGWSHLPAGIWKGLITTRQGFIAAARSAGILVHAWPSDAPHPLSRCGVAVVARCDSRSELLSRAKSANASRRTLAGGSADLSEALLSSILENALAVNG